MVLLERLRNKGAIFVGIAIGIAMLAFILTDFLTSGRSMFGGDDLVVGSVDGRTLDYMDYLGQVDERIKLQQAMSGGQPLDEQMHDYIREQIWQQFVREQVLVHECDKIGLQVTAEELSSVILGPTPHPVVSQLFSNPETQEFDREQMLMFLQNLESPDVAPAHRQYWIEVESELQSELLMQKFQTLTAKSLYFTSIDRELAANTAANKVDVAYVLKSFNTIPDSVLSVTDDEARAYYQAHRKAYEQPERRDVAYVLFDIKPQAVDYEAAELWMKNDRDEFVETEDPGKYASENGDVQYTGKWSTREDLPANIADWAFDVATVGETSEVFTEPDRYVAARLIGKKILPDSAHARHILFSNQRYTPDRAQQLADSLKQLIAGGADFATLAEEYSDDPGSKSSGGDLDWFAQGTMVKPFSDACFEGKIGDVVIVTSNFGVHLIEVLGHRGASERVDVAIFARNVVAGTETYQTIFNEASAFAANAHQARPSWLRRMFGAGKNRAEEVEIGFDSLVSLNNLNKQLASDLELNSRRISGIEDARPLIRWAFESAPGDVSSVFELGQHFAVAMLVRVKESEDGVAVFDAVREKVLSSALEEKKSEYLTREFNEAGREDLDAIASKVGESVRRANGVEFASYAFGREGFEPAAVGASCSLPSGEISKPIRGNGGVYILQVESSSPADSGDGNSLESEQKSRRSRISYEAYENLKQMCHIKDLRGKFF